MIRRLATVIAIALLFRNPASAAADPEQQRCINALNKDGAQVAAVQGKLAAGCVRDAGKRALPIGQTADECLSDDPKEALAKAVSKTQSDYDDRCATNPPVFGVPGSAVVATVNGAALDHALGLVADVFGPSLEAAIVGCDDDGDACKCQRSVFKAAVKLAAAKRTEFRTCKRSALKPRWSTSETQYRSPLVSASRCRFNCRAVAAERAAAI